MQKTAKSGQSAKDLRSRLFLICASAVGRLCSDILEWNFENHFVDPDIRMAKAYAWMTPQGEGHFKARVLV